MRIAHCDVAAGGGSSRAICLPSAAVQMQFFNSIPVFRIPRFFRIFHPNEAEQHTDEAPRSSMHVVARL